MNNNTAQTLQVANTIADQIGARAFAMMGATNKLADASSLTFKVGRNARKVTHVTVTLDPTDTYTVEFVKCGRAPRYTRTVLATVSNVYEDGLRAVIETNTGLYLSL